MMGGMPRGAGLVGTRSRAVGRPRTGDSARGCRRPSMRTWTFAAGHDLSSHWSHVASLSGSDKSLPASWLRFPGPLQTAKS